MTPDPKGPGSFFDEKRLEMVAGAGFGTSEVLQKPTQLFSVKEFDVVKQVLPRPYDSLRTK